MSQETIAELAEPSRVEARVFCPSCCEQVGAMVQFRYGEPETFQIGDQVRAAGESSVVAEGFVEGACPACGWEGAWPVEVWLERDRLVAVRPPSRKFNWVAAGSYIALPGGREK